MPHTTEGDRYRNILLLQYIPVGGPFSFHSEVLGHFLPATDVLIIDLFRKFREGTTRITTSCPISSITVVNDLNLARDLNNFIKNMLKNSIYFDGL